MGKHNKNIQPYFTMNMIKGKIKIDYMNARYKTVFISNYDESLKYMKIFFIYKYI